MSDDSVWLGQFRKPVRQTAIISACLTLLVFVILVFNKAFLNSGVGVHEMLRPEGGILAWTFMSQIGRAHVRTPVTEKSRMPSSA